MKIFALFWTTFAVTTLSLSGQDDETLIRIAKEGFEARGRAGGLTNKPAAVQAFRKSFEGLEDSLKIKAIALYLYDIDHSNSKWSMSTAITMVPGYALRDDPDFISDWSSLREMLQHEKDSRKFYLLSILVPPTENESKYNFIAVQAHMLFANGRVAKDEGEYTRSYAHDVSEFAYIAITSKLRVLGADFEPPPMDLPHEEKAAILAKWLKKNWPRCENIEIPSRLLGESSRPQKSLVEKTKKPLPQGTEEVPIEHKEANDETEKSRLLWITAGVLVVGILALLIKTWKGK